MSPAACPGDRETASVTRIERRPGDRRSKPVSSAARARGWWKAPRLQLSQNRVPVDAEHAGSAAVIPSRPLNHSQDILPLELLAGLFQG